MHLYLLLIFATEVGLTNENLLHWLIFGILDRSLYKYHRNMFICRYIAYLISRIIFTAHSSLHGII